MAGLREPLRVLPRAGIRTVGAGLTEAEAHAPLSVRVNGHRSTSSTSAKVRISRRPAAVLACSAGTCGWPRRSRGRSSGAAAWSSRSGTAGSSTCRTRRLTWLPRSGRSRRRRRLRDRPSSARAAGPRMAPRPADPLQPRQLRLLPADGPALPEDRVLRAFAARAAASGLALHPYRITDSGCGASTRRKRAFGGTLARLSRPFRTAAGPRAHGTPICSTTGTGSGRGHRDSRTDESRAAEGRGHVPQPPHHHAARGTLEDALTRVIEGNAAPSRADYDVVRK